MRFRNFAGGSLKLTCSGGRFTIAARIASGHCQTEYDVRSVLVQIEHHLRSKIVEIIANAVEFQTLLAEHHLENREG